MEAEIKEALNYLANHAGGLTPGELELVKGFRKYAKEHEGQLSERQRSTLFEIRKHRERSEQHLY